MCFKYAITVALDHQKIGKVQKEYKILNPTWTNTIVSVEIFSQDQSLKQTTKQSPIMWWTRKYKTNLHHKMQLRS